ncbi:MAG: hypothetical protein SV910_08615 [Chloroflexota bacterium]|nr:hypothetical protein [Chloroflexota bacterium]
MDRELLNNIQLYLNGYCTLHELEVWLLSNLQSLLDSGNKAAIQIANDLDADLIQLSEAIIDENTIRDRLQGYLSQENTVVETIYDDKPTATIAATAAVNTIRNHVVIPDPAENVRVHLVLA